ncbi:MAG: 6,7-dimethyl-8-ribityllumazine synthase [Pirellulales bacterium]|nr:6,7-dimethyl-8-ribityllumazine synthase [Pirellulales bacterium]
MPNVFQGKPTETDGRFAVVVSRFNESVTSRLLDGAVRTLVEHGVADERIDVFWTPGAFEIPTVAALLAEEGRHAAIICLGAVVRGETTHDQHINRAVSTALCELGVRYQLPVLFGLLTCNTIEQAIARSGGRESSTGKDHPDAHLGNKGVDCALAALEMVDLMTKTKPSVF